MPLKPDALPLRRAVECTLRLSSSFAESGLPRLPSRGLFWRCSRQPALRPEGLVRR